MKPSRFFAAILALGWSLSVPAAAEGTPFSWREDFCASATANVFDGGPVMSEEGCGTIFNKSGFIVSAFDFTQAGSLGASALGSNRSLLFADDDDLSIQVRLLAGYFPSFLPGGDNPGGMAAAELSSVIEFELPVDELQWWYELDIDHLQPNPFIGSAHVLIENVTRSEILADLSEETLDVETVLKGSAGDLIRITSEMSGSGSMGPGSRKIYAAELRALFVIPEPWTLTLLLVGTAVLPANPLRGHRTAHTSTKTEGE